MSTRRVATEGRLRQPATDLPANSSRDGEAREEDQFIRSLVSNAPAASLRRDLGPRVVRAVPAGIIWTEAAAIPMKRPIDNRKDLLLLLLYSPGRSGELNEPIAGRTRLMKMLFLFKEEALVHFRAGTQITAENFYDFFPWNFGPFSRDVYDDLTFFELRGFIERTDTDEETIPEAAAEWDRWLTLSRAYSADDAVTEYDEQEFRLSPKGVQFAAELYESLSLDQRRLLKEFKGKLNRIPLRAILQYVYENYDKQTTRSQIKERVLGRRPSA